MVEKLRIPPVFVEAEAAPLPPETAFRKRPVEQITAGDAVLIHGQVWRVKDRRTSRTSPRITLILWPLLGGRPQRLSFFPREWLPAASGAQTI